MTISINRESLLDAITALADAIARRSPDCAEDARQIASLAGDLRAGRPDRGAIRDALDAETVDSDMSDGQVRTATEAVVKISRDDDA